MYLRRALLLAAVLPLLAAAPARAGRGGWYIGAAGGWSKLDHVDSTNSSFLFKSEETNGYAVLGFAGYDFGGFFRLEGELGYRRHDVKSLAVVNDGGLGNKIGVGSLTGASAHPSGHVSAASLMVNGLFNIVPSWRISPYIGGGIGAANVTLNKVAVAGTTVASGSDGRLAGQGIAGVGGKINEHVSLALDYRYFLTLDPTFRDASGAPFRSHYRTQNVLLSVVYHFGSSPQRPTPAPEPLPVEAPPPVAAAPVATPVPPPPPPPPRMFLVFFDFDKASLTPDGAALVEEAARTYASAGAARIDLAGYTDSVGTVAYNLPLSKRRADTVRAYLVKLGVPAAAIVETARGKENLRVPTADGVREPQNRRVEIRLP
jgi:outer membrane protein OmpA-like peptidoglycan-associated protein